MTGGVSEHLTTNAVFGFFKSRSNAGGIPAKYADAQKIVPTDGSQPMGFKLNLFNNIPCRTLDVAKTAFGNYSGGYEFCTKQKFNNCAEIITSQGNMTCSELINCQNVSDYSFVNKTIIVDDVEIRNITKTITIIDTEFYNETVIIPRQINKKISLDYLQEYKVNIAESDIKNLNFSDFYL